MSCKALAKKTTTTDLLLFSFGDKIHVTTFKLRIEFTFVNQKIFSLFMAWSVNIYFCNILFGVTSFYKILYFVICFRLLG